MTQHSCTAPPRRAPHPTIDGTRRREEPAQPHPPDAAGLIQRILLAGLIAAGVAACSPAPPATAVAACPMPVARWVQCPQGQRVSAYEPAPDLESYCSALADPVRQLRAVRPGSPVYELPGGYRTVLTGSSGWLVFPPDKGPLDVGPGIARWWREAGCAPL